MVGDWYDYQTWWKSSYNKSNIMEYTEKEIKGQKSKTQFEKN